MNTPDFGTKLESIKHIGDMVDGKMVCREDCPSITHRNTPDTEWEKELEQEIPKLTFNSLDNGVNTISLVWLKSFIRTLLSSRDTYWKERVRKEYQVIKETPAYVNLMTEWGQLDEDGVCIAVSRQALEETMQALDTLLDNLK